MEGLNKFKIWTLIIICMFLFAIAAIYTNTKDVSKSQMNDQEVYEQQGSTVQSNNTVEYRGEMESRRMSNSSHSNNNYNNSRYNGNQDYEQSSTSSEIFSALSSKIDSLNKRIDKIENNMNRSSGMNCNIMGTMGDRGFEQLTESAAIQEARINNKKLVITCSF